MYTIHTSADLPQILTVPSDLSIQIPRCCLCTAWQTTSHVMAELASLRHSCCYIPYCLAASGSYISQSGLPAAIGTRLACRSLSYDHGCECVLISATHVNFSESEISRSITWQFPYQRPLWCPRIIFRTHFLNDAHYLHLNSLEEVWCQQCDSDSKLKESLQSQRHLFKGSNLPTSIQWVETHGKAYI